jgi:hypothetical protein
MGEDTARFVQVNEKLMECLSVYPPNGQAKLDLLAEVLLLSLRGALFLRWGKA